MKYMQTTKVLCSYIASQIVYKIRWPWQHIEARGQSEHCKFPLITTNLLSRLVNSCWSLLLPSVFVCLHLMCLLHAHFLHKKNGLIAIYMSSELNILTHSLLIRDKTLHAWRRVPCVVRCKMFWAFQVVF